MTSRPPSRSTADGGPPGPRRQPQALDERRAANRAQSKVSRAKRSALRDWLAAENVLLRQRCGLTGDAEVVPAATYQLPAAAEQPETSSIAAYRALPRAERNRMDAAKSTQRRKALVRRLAVENANMRDRLGLPRESREQRAMSGLLSPRPEHARRAALPQAATTLEVAAPGSVAGTARPDAPGAHGGPIAAAIARAAPPWARGSIAWPSVMLGLPAPSRTPPQAPPPAAPAPALAPAAAAAAAVAAEPPLSLLLSPPALTRSAGDAGPPAFAAARAASALGDGASADPATYSRWAPPWPGAARPEAGLAGLLAPRPAPLPSPFAMALTLAPDVYATPEARATERLLSLPSIASWLPTPRSPLTLLFAHDPWGSSARDSLLAILAEPSGSAASG